MPITFIFFWVAPIWLRKNVKKKSGSAIKNPDDVKITTKSAKEKCEPCKYINELP